MRMVLLHSAPLLTSGVRCDREVSALESEKLGRPLDDGETVDWSNYPKLAHALLIQQQAILRNKRMLLLYTYARLLLRCNHGLCRCFEADCLKHLMRRLQIKLLEMSSGLLKYICMWL